MLCTRIWATYPSSLPHAESTPGQLVSCWGRGFGVPHEFANHSLSVPILGIVVLNMGTEHQADRVARVLFGVVRREVLVLLFGRADERFYLREVMRAVGRGSGAVQRELKELVDAGLVTREMRGHQTYFSANRGATVFHELRAIVEKTTGPAEVLRACLAGHLGRIMIAFIFGSVATGLSTAGSDVDLLIIGEVSLEEILPAVRTSQERLGREVNPSVYPLRELRQKVKRGVPFLKRVLGGPKIFVFGDEAELERLTR
jgi:uncharacterized protein